MDLPTHLSTQLFSGCKLPLDFERREFVDTGEITAIGRLEHETVKSIITQAEAIISHSFELRGVAYGLCTDDDISYATYASFMARDSHCEVVIAFPTRSHDVPTTEIHIYTTGDPTMGDLNSIVDAVAGFHHMDA